MATAGRILIMPKGTWNAETTYENLDMVAHSGRAWLAKKTSVGIEPSGANAEYWHDFLGMELTAEALGALPATNGAVKNLKLDSAGDQCYIMFMKNWANMGHIGVNGVDNPVFIPHDASAIYKLFGEHNKPSGEYQGNGSADIRTFEIGGTGRLLHVYSGDGGYDALVGHNGTKAWYADGTEVTLKASEGRFANGYLLTNTASPILNGNYKYYYEVL